MQAVCVIEVIHPAGQTAAADGDIDHEVFPGTAAEGRDTPGKGPGLRGQIPEIIVTRGAHRQDAFGTLAPQHGRLVAVGEKALHQILADPVGAKRIKVERFAVVRGLADRRGQFKPQAIFQKRLCRIAVKRRQIGDRDDTGQSTRFRKSSGGKCRPSFLPAENRPRRLIILPGIACVFRIRPEIFRRKTVQRMFARDLL